MAEKAEVRILEKYLPAATLPLILEWLSGQRVHLKITNGRSSKLGDYRPPIKDPSHRISVNNDLNPYSFLLTLVHEIAHMKVWIDYGRKVRPHGQEWKNRYRQMLKEIVELGVLPEDIQQGFLSYSGRIAASGVSDQALVLLLRKYDPPGKKILLEELKHGSMFRVSNGRRFRKMEKLRKRFRCELLPSGRIYLFSPLAVVEPINESAD